MRLLRLPLKRECLEALGEILNHCSIVRLPGQDRGMVAVTQNHVAMQLALKRLPITRRGSAFLRKSILSVATGIDDHDAVGVGSVQKLRARRGVPRAVQVTSRCSQVAQVAPLLFLSNG